MPTSKKKIGESKAGQARAPRRSLLDFPLPTGRPGRPAQQGPGAWKVRTAEAPKGSVGKLGGGEPKPKPPIDQS